MAVLVVCASALAITVQARRLVSAREMTDSGRGSLLQARADAREIEMLRSLAETVQPRPRPEKDVIARVTAALEEAGIQSQALTDLRQQGDRPVSNAGQPRGTGLREQSLQVTLRGLTPAQIGVWLVHWRESQAIWRITRLDLTHSRQDDADSNRFDATVILTALYLDDGRTSEGS